MENPIALKKLMCDLLLLFLVVAVRIKYLLEEVCHMELLALFLKK